MNGELVGYKGKQKNAHRTQEKEEEEKEILVSYSGTVIFH